MRTKILFDLDKKFFVVAIKPHWWNKWFIDYSFSTYSMKDALERKEEMRHVGGTIRILKKLNKEK